jgi:3-hydroxyisobutyrate dehydrogenase-like beta-hydroxyacid dehydrogenase
MGTMLSDHSTIAVSMARKIAEAAQARGVSFLDAPVSGGVPGAQAATLTIMVGGDPEAFERARPVFEAEGKNIRHIGASGAGTVVKLVNQLMLLANMGGVVEGMVLGVKAGIDPQVLFEVLSTGFAGSAMLTRSAPLFQQRKFDSGSNISLYIKDIGLFRQLAKDLGVRILVGDQAASLIEEAARMGYGDSDLAALVLPQEHFANVQVVRPTALE